MTEEEKDIERSLKPKVSDELTAAKLAVLGKFKGIFENERLKDYVCMVIDNPAEHNLYEQLAVKRFFDHLCKYEYRPKEVNKFCKLYEALEFPGANGATSYKLTPIQMFQVCNIFGFFVDGKRLCRQAYIYVPRKFSKTTFTAAVCIYDLFFGDKDAEAYVAANTFDQAKICFNMIRNVLLNIDPREKHFKVNRETVSYKSGDRDSFIKCLSSSPKKKDGLKASTVIIDEYSQATSAELKQTLTSSMGTRINPLTIVITTGSDLVDSVFAHELSSVKMILRGEMDNDRIFGSLFMPDVDDDESVETTWKKVQPHWGVTIQEDFYDLSYKEALLSAENMMLFRTKMLNIMTMNEAASWLTVKLAQKISRPIKLENYKNRPEAMCAFDLSETDDFTAVAFSIYNQVNKSFDYHVQYFFPRGSMETHPNRLLYEQWVQNGYLILTEGNVVDYSAIVQYILYCNRFVKILAIGYDSWKSLEPVTMLESTEARGHLMAVPQSYGAFTAPCQSFHVDCEKGRAYINENPINNFCFGNAILDEDKNGNKKIIKRGCSKGGSHSNKNKIDGLVAILMCKYMFLHFER